MSDEIKKIQIVTKHDFKNNKKNLAFLDKLTKFLKSEKKEVIINSKNKDIDLLITLGGDGTLLRAGRDLKNKTLILGVNFGTVGFLTECLPEETFSCLKKIFQKKIVIDKRSLLNIDIYRNNKKVKSINALNEAVINQGSFARLIKIGVEVDDNKLVTFKGDGIIIATPSGSTAHSLSAGGPIVHPYIEGIIITPICPISLSMRPIILPDKKKLTVTIDTLKRENTNTLGLTIDGQDMNILQNGDKIIFSRSSKCIHLARIKHQYYEILHNKLHWGEDK